MAEPVYTFDKQSMRRISTAVQKSEGVKDRNGNGWYPVRGGAGKSYPIMVGKTTQEWTKNNGQIIQPLDPVTENPIGEPVSVINLFATVASGKWVAFSKTAQEQAILLSAECD
jgi:hypothetical protein